MMVDDYEIDEKPDTAMITPAESPQEPEADPPADDCMNISFPNPFIVADSMNS